MPVDRTRSRGCLVIGMGVILVLMCASAAILVSRFRQRDAGGQEALLSIAYSPDKAALYEELARRFNASNPRLANGERVGLQITALSSEQMVEVAGSNAYQAMSPDSSFWLAEIDRKWGEEQGTDVPLVGDTVRGMVSPVVIAMWRDVATSLGYPTEDLGWQDLLRAAENPQFKWSHPSANTASGLLATLAIFYAGSGLKRDLTQEVATAQTTIDYVTRLEKTVKYYGEGELAIMQQVERQGRSYLDAFVVQEWLVVQYNRAHDSDQLVAIYPIEGTLWADHPLALLEHPERTDEERLAFGLFKQFLLSPDTQRLILQQGYRPTDLSISLDESDSPMTAASGVDPTRPYTTLQMPSPAVVSVIRNAWQLAKRRTNIFLIADVSGSMQGAKLKDAKAALQIFLEQVESDQERIGLIAFSSSATERVPLTQLGQGRGRLQAAIEDLEAGGNTALLDAVDLALLKLEDLRDAERINAIIVMTDGKENRSRIRDDGLVERLRQAATSDVPVVVFCIAYGRDADMRMLESISSASGGFTREGDLETIKNLYKTLSTYF